jgi:hypothetical protein
MRIEAKTPRQSQGHNASAYEVIGVVGGLAYVAAVGYFRIRT